MPAMALTDELDQAAAGAFARPADRLAAGAVERALGGDTDAFRWIVETFSSDMRQVAYVTCGDLDLAEEAVAASWPIAWRRLHTIRDAARLRSWLVAVAANEARRLSSRRRRRSVREISVESPEAEASSLRDSRAASGDLAEAIDLGVALARLEPADRSLLALRYVAGLNSTELATATGLTPAGTRARLQRLLDRMRRELGE
jgi:RNA polymerase sigma factor (sigma-70 family)